MTPCRIGGNVATLCAWGVPCCRPDDRKRGCRRLRALMEAAQEGDAASYQAVLRACVPVAAATARRNGIPPDRVDDVVQEVLLTVHRARPTYDPARPFLPWLRAIAQRRAIDAMRSHGRRGGREVHDEVAYLNHADTGSDADALSRPGCGRPAAACRDCHLAGRAAPGCRIAWPAGTYAGGGVTQHRTHQGRAEGQPPPGDQGASGPAERGRRCLRLRSTC